ncbi:MAG: DUF1893 domain-containing protein [Patescibacteria group bacterium]|nr:DUF1893 domain-containing protein [Patescibacteria group bacterium]
MEVSFSEFKKNDYSFVLFRNEKIIYRSRMQELKPLVFCVKKHKKEMRGAVVFDKVVGRTAAMLLAHAKVKEVWTPTVSTGGKKYLLKNKIKLQYQKEVKNIMNRKGDSLCPMEKLSREKGSKIIKQLLS